MKEVAWKHIGLWAITLFIVIIVSVFLHETGHGLGARLDGIHVSTGFNKVGDYGKSPDDPEFRSSGREGAFWSGLLGPVTTWFLAILFTVWLYRFKLPSCGALTVGALAVANGLGRAVPMLIFLAFTLRGRLHVEDEVTWGIWLVANFFRPDAASTGLQKLVNAQPARLLSYPAVWIPPLLSLVISLACLVPAYLRLFKLWRMQLSHVLAIGTLGLLPVLAYAAAFPVLNTLDRLVRINW